MILPIYVYGHPILRKKAVNIEQKDPGLEQLIEDMFETMYHAQGVGLAAPQIGNSIRLFVIDSTAFREAYPEAEIFKGAFINPTILKEYGDDFSFNEGCLSLPDIHEDVIRKSEIEIEYMDEKGEIKNQTFNGFVARIIQHEYDHLEGQVFTDKVTPLKKMLLKRKLGDIATGKTKTNYKTKNK
ncbi:MAG: peptide deformylase [Bacteroidales bacterium]